MTQAHLESRQFLTGREVDRLVAAARRDRHGERDALLVLLAYRHALRASEIVGLRVDDVDVESGCITVRRLKHGVETTQPLAPDEVDALGAWLAARGRPRSPLLFLGERGPLTRQAVNYLFREIGERAGVGLRVTPRLLRHSRGYDLAETGCGARHIQHQLGHRFGSAARRYVVTGDAPPSRQSSTGGRN